MMWIQLDKAIYKPGETIKYQALVLNEWQVMMDKKQQVDIQIQVSSAFRIPETEDVHYHGLVSRTQEKCHP